MARATGSSQELMGIVGAAYEQAKVLPLGQKTLDARCWDQLSKSNCCLAQHHCKQHDLHPRQQTPPLPSPLPSTHPTSTERSRRRCQNICCTAARARTHENTHTHTHERGTPPIPPCITARRCHHTLDERRKKAPRTDDERTCWK